ncbi:MAG: DNA repair protein RadC [Deltaproteobacteria bacterium]|nr:DNA repair protein RadC [Deltaproteobacteria bacterium]
MPREKLLGFGAQSLSETELLSIILQTGTKGKDVFALAVELINLCGGIAGIESVGIDELVRVGGMSTAKATKLKAAVEIGRRAIYASRALRRRIANSRDAFMLLEPVLRSLPKENFVVMLLNSRNDVVDIKKVGEGTVNAASIYPRELMELAIRSSATGIILSHNHPSGGTSPSTEDRRLTMNILVLGELANMVLHDHIIVGAEDYFSFADEGALASMKQQFLRAIAV